jgi:hypothetical protein
MPLKWFSDQSTIRTPRLGSRERDPGSYLAPAAAKNASVSPHVVWKRSAARRAGRRSSYSFVDEPKKSTRWCATSSRSVVRFVSERVDDDASASSDDAEASVVDATASGSRLGGDGDRGGGGAFGLGGGDRGDDGDRGDRATTLLMTFGGPTASDANRWVRVAPLGVVTGDLPAVFARHSSGTDNLEEPGPRPPVMCAAANRNATPKAITWSTRAGRARRTAARDAALIGATEIRRRGGRARESGE